ncbi:MAG: alpha/beta hydrolase [Planctomycetota bacterium]|nr:alpha/beta hydrolase [Planctomycetota bacterium]
MEPEKARPKSLLRRVFFSLLCIVVLSWLGLTAVLYFYQKKLIYFPKRQLDGTPAEAHLDFDDVLFQTSDGVQLHGWFIPARPERAVVLFCHGNAGNISGRIESARLLNDMGLSVLLFDYRGYGRSEGKPSEKGTYLDAEAAWLHLVEVRGIDPGRIIIQGRSLGGAIAAHLAVRHRPKALIVESAFTSAPELAKRYYPFLPRWLCRFKYDTLQAVQEVSRPVLIVHSRGDDLVPFTHGERLFAAARQPKRFIALAGGHNDGIWVSNKVYREGLDAFLREYVDSD